MLKPTAVAIAIIAASPAYAWEKLTIDKGCGFGQTFDGPGETTIAISQTKDQYDLDQVLVLVFNDNWSIKASDTIKENIEISAERYGINGQVSAVDNGFILYPTNALMEAFDHSFPLAVEIKKGKLKIDQLNFSGFSSAYGEFNFCRREWRSEKATRDRMKKLERALPKDPFAKQ